MAMRPISAVLILAGVVVVLVGSGFDIFGDPLPILSVLMGLVALLVTYTLAPPEEQPKPDPHQVDEDSGAGTATASSQENSEVEPSAGRLRYIQRGLPAQVTRMGEGASVAVSGTNGGHVRTGVSAPHRALRAELPQRADTGQRISLIINIVQVQADTPGTLRPFQIPQEGRTVVITVRAPGLDAEGDLEQDLLVPPRGDSDPIRFGFRTRGAGLQEVLVRAFAGGTFIGEVVAQVSVEVSAPLEEGRPVSGAGLLE